MLNTQGVINNSVKFRINLRGNWASKIDGMICGRLMIHIYDNPVETEVDLIGRISSVLLNIKKYAIYICSRTQRTLCVASSITM
jgi:predicted nuclease of restriction endonuclease-like RecB superfamily